MFPLCLPGNYSVVKITFFFIILSFLIDAAVGSGELWFVNFYSPRCSHCHDLAPTVGCHCRCVVIKFMSLFVCVFV